MNSFLNPNPSPAHSPNPNPNPDPTLNPHPSSSPTPIIGRTLCRTHILTLLLTLTQPLTLLLCDHQTIQTSSLLRWLSLYTERGDHPPLRMLIHSALNMGYFCGEFHLLAASLPVWRRFPWVMYNSGPDSMLTPDGGVAFARWLAIHRRASFLGFPFLSVPGQQRWTMDLFAFWPQTGIANENWSVWLNATRWCLFGWAPDEELPIIHAAKVGYRADYSPIPEMLLDEVHKRFQLPFRLFPGGGGYVEGDRKDTAQKPAMRTFARGQEAHSL